MKELVKLLKSKGWEYQILRNGLYSKEAIYFVLGNEEVIIFKGEIEKLQAYKDIIENW